MERSSYRVSIDLLNNNTAQKPVDILLVNSLPPRQRSLSDTALENSLAIIRTYLEDKGFNIEVVDCLRFDLLEEGVPKWCFTYLRFMIRHQLTAYFKGSKIRSLLFMLAAWPFHSYALRRRKRYMRDLIDYIVMHIKEKNIPFVGIKTWYGESFKWSGLLASRIRFKCPETVVIAGGPQVIVYRERVIKNEKFDLAVMGPGEKVLERLLMLRRETGNRKDFLERVFKENNGSRIITKDGALIKGMRLEPPADEIVIPRYRTSDLKGKILFHTLVDGFGCTWNKCAFCINARQYTHYRPRSVDQVVEEIKAMVGRGIVFFRFSSSNTPISHSRKIAQAILESGLKIRYSMFNRCAKLTQERFDTYQMMIKAGLRAVFIGAETGHDAVNEKIMNKGITRQEIVDTINAIREAAEIVGESCKIALSLIYPCPVPDGVSIEDIFQANLSLIEQVYPDTVIVNPPGAFPETPWFEDSQHFHFDIGRNFINKLMYYEYALYKPPEFWPKLDISLQGLTVEKILSETGRLRRQIASMGIPTEISDEYLMMADAIGSRSKEELIEFKRNSLIDIFSGSVTYTKKIINEINNRSKALAKLQMDAIADV